MTATTLTTPRSLPYGATGQGGHGPRRCSGRGSTGRPWGRLVDDRQREGKVETNGTSVGVAQVAAVRTLAEQFRAARRQKGLSLADMARRCGLTRPAISRLENGQRLNPTLDTLFRYAAALGLELTLTARALSKAPAAPAEPPVSPAPKPRGRGPDFTDTANPLT